jgi:hypothetical protein
MAMNGPTERSIAPIGNNLARAFLALAIVLHLSLLLSWRMGFWDRYTFDATATQGWRGWDFFALYQAGRNVLDGVSAYESDNDKIDVVVPRYTPYRYLPLPAYSVGVALNLLPPLWAFRLWVAFTELALLGCAWFCGRLAKNRRDAWVVMAMWLSFTPYYLEIYLGQFSIVQTAFILAMLAAAMGGAPRWQGDLAWILSLLWKQNTALFAPVLLRLRRWRVLGLAALAIAVTAIPYFAAFPSALPAFLANLRSGPPSFQLGNLGLRQLLFSLSSWFLPHAPIEQHALLQQLWVALIIAIGIWRTWSSKKPDTLLQLCLWTTTYFLIYHHVWEHHYVMLLPVFAMLYLRTHSPLVLALYALVALWTPYVLIDPAGIAAYHAPMRWTPLEPRILDVCYHASKALPTLALWGYILWLMHRPAHSADSDPCSPC